MLHEEGHWLVSPVESPEELAIKLTERPRILCTGFSLKGYLFLNDSTSVDGAQEYAVIKSLPDGGYVQVESITFSWCTTENALELIRELISGGFDEKADVFGHVTPNFKLSHEPPLPALFA